MKVTPAAIPEVLLIEPRGFDDARGAFVETWQLARYSEAVTPLSFVQDNVSVSRRGVVRGLHFQHPHGQGKLVMVLAGAAWDVAVDVRRGSPSFGRWVAEELTEGNRRQLWIPAGFAHGFQALSDGVVFHYKCTDTYRPECERTVLWSDPALAIPWPLSAAVVAAKDAAAPSLADLPPEHLPSYR